MTTTLQTSDTWRVPNARRGPGADARRRGLRAGELVRSQRAAAEQTTVPLERHELQLLAIVATGLPLASVGRRLGISDRTVRRRIRCVCTKLDVTTLIQAVAWAARHRLI